jgi:deoxyribonuclease-4
MSIAGGPAGALRAGQSIGCDTIQIFTRNANRWASKDLTADEIAAFHVAVATTGIHPVVAHSSYLINLGSPDEELWNKSVQALVTELQRCRQLGVRDYVLHPGSHTGAGEEAGLQRVATALTAALAATAGAEVAILLEITAGQGSSLGCTFAQLAGMIAQATPQERLGVCFDTCHALAAGYEFRTRAAYEAMWNEFEAIIGLGRLRAIHLNDALKDRGSRVDRHTHIGKGFVGLEAFRLIVNDARLRHVPMLLETPKGPELREDVENLAVLRSLIEGT